MAAERRASVTWNGDLMSGSGTIDEVAVYDHALSAARIAAHHQAGAGTP